MRTERPPASSPAELWATEVEQQQAAAGELSLVGNVLERHRPPAWVERAISRALHDVEQHERRHFLPIG